MIKFYPVKLFLCLVCKVKVCIVILVFILSFPKASVGDDNITVLSSDGVTLSEVKLYHLTLLIC